MFAKDMEFLGHVNGNDSRGNKFVWHTSRIREFNSILLQSFNSQLENGDYIAFKPSRRWKNIYFVERESWKQIGAGEIQTLRKKAKIRKAFYDTDSNLALAIGIWNDPKYFLDGKVERFEAGLFAMEWKDPLMYIRTRMAPQTFFDYFGKSQAIAGSFEGLLERLRNPAGCSIIRGLLKRHQIQ